MGLFGPVMRLLYLFTVFCVVNLWILSTTDSKTSKNHETASGAVRAGHHKWRAERAAILFSGSSSRLIALGAFATTKKVGKTTTSYTIYVRPPSYKLNACPHGTTRLQPDTFV
jgi:hypothetical protein